MIWKLPIFIITLSLLPSAAISFYMIQKYKSEGLSTTLYVQLMIWGALAVIPGVVLVSLASGLYTQDFISIYLFKPFIAVALIEEMIKLLIIKLVLYRNSHFRNVKNGIQYSIAISVGFAFAENILYLTSSGESFPLIVTRSLTALPLHTICGSFMGYYAGLGKTGEIRYFGKALFSAVIIHGLYNILVNLYFPYYLLSIILMILSLIFLKQQYSKKIGLSSFKDT
jgi:protease PrsW